MKRPRVSVLIPARNADRFVSEQMRCVLDQDFQDLEVVACDNGSTDATWAALSPYKTHPRVRLLRDRKGMTVGAVRNHLIRQARGEYIMPCDADDWLLQGSVSALTSILDRNPSIGYCYGSYLMLETGGHGRLVRPPWVRGRAHRPDSDLMEFTANHAGSLMRRHLVLAVGGYDEDTSLDSVSLTLKLSEITRFHHASDRITYVYRRRARAGQRPDWAQAFLHLARKAIRRRTAVLTRRTGQRS